jgi:hypothetical protein
MMVAAMRRKRLARGIGWVSQLVQLRSFLAVWTEAKRAARRSAAAVKLAGVRKRLKKRTKIGIAIGRSGQKGPMKSARERSQSRGEAI